MDHIKKNVKDKKQESQKKPENQMMIEEIKKLQTECFSFLKKKF